MFDIGLQELIVIFVVALIVFGPKRLPEIGKSLGKGLAELKRAMEDVKQQVNSEVGDLKDPLDLKNQLYMNKDAPSAQDKVPESYLSDSVKQETASPSGEGIDPSNDAGVKG
jgi:Tat protein translocase TatB subunit